jgi:hypothetical protein
MKLTPVTLALMVGLIGAAGFFVGRLSSPDVSQDEALAAEQRPGGRITARGDAAAGAPGERPGARPASRRSAGEGSAEQRRARIEEIVRGENALDRNRALLSFIDGLAPDEFADAIAHFRSLGLTESRMGEYSLLLTAWAKLDPTAALSYAAENTRGTYASSTILTAWASNDPEAAIRWAQANHEGDGPNTHMIGVIRGIAESDPNRATALMQEMPRSRERGEALAAMMPHVLKNGPDAARAWVASIDDEALRSGAIERFAGALAAVDPQGTANWLLANPGEASRNQMDDVFNAWARQDQQAALGSFAALPSGEERTNALRGLASAVAASDPKAAVAMIDRYRSDVNDRVIEDVVRSSFATDPSLATSQIAKMTNEGQRDRAYRRALDMWIGNDRNAAQAWIQSNPLPDPVWEHVSRRLQQQ